MLLVKEYKSRSLDIIQKAEQAGFIPGNFNPIELKNNSSLTRLTIQRQIVLLQEAVQKMHPNTNYSNIQIQNLFAKETCLLINAVKGTVIATKEGSS